MLREDEIDAQLQRILQSPAFAGAARSRQFLEYCVNRSRNGDTAHLKETTIAIEVFLRAVDYDPKSDPIVRVHARRVREKLQLYYRTVGAEDPILIQLPKGGYVPSILRSIAEKPSLPLETQRSEPTVAVEEPAPMPASPNQTAVRTGWRWLAAAVIVLAIASVLLWKWSTQESRRRSVLLKALEPVDTMPRDASDVVWAPDGKRIAFTSRDDRDHHLHVYLKDMRPGAVPVQLTSAPQEEMRPAWSPDGKEIALARFTDFYHFDVVRVQVASHHERTMGRFLNFWKVESDHPALDWSHDGRYLLTTEQATPGVPLRIILMNAATGERSFLTSPPASSSGDVEAKFSPDSKWVAFRRGGLGDLFIVSVRGEQAEPARRLTFDNHGVRGIAWSQDSKSIVFGSQRNNSFSFSLWRIAAEGGTPEPVTGDDFEASDPSISNEDHLLVRHRKVVTELVSTPLTPGRPMELHTLFAGDSTASSPVYSPDGQSVLYVSTKTGWGELWLYHVRDSTTEQLTHLDGNGLVLFPSWSPDTRTVSFSLRTHGMTNIVIYDIAQRRSRMLTSTQNRDIASVYSADGRYLYFSSNDDGTPRIWRIAVDGAEHPEPLFIEGTMGFVLSPDGRWLYTLSGGTSPVVLRRSLSDGTTEEVFRLPGRATFYNNLAVTRRNVYVAVSQENAASSSIYAVDPETKSSRIAATLTETAPSTAGAIGGFTVSPDDAMLIFAHTQYDNTTILSTNH
ncbi:MAG: hypothetical protein PW789_16645 [Edaphobacter sp.]|uniref:hypothetical protein n=1 Tax=Edaphobacter sp. TaxID=1934404 RepID=UPI0023A5AB45|nr:hypothetical protein [Edaphobacter sp.]MDE1178204.1 hypothetical protein [Edaphobacter sp.]